LGRDAPAERLDDWIDIAVQVDTFVGFAIGRSNWEDPLRDNLSSAADDDTTRNRIAQRYLHFVHRWWCTAG
jgi:myo-inositol catabolism protein IolC